MTQKAAKNVQNSKFTHVYFTNGSLGRFSAIFWAKKILLDCHPEAAESLELGEGDGHLGLVVGVLVDVRPLRVQLLGQLDVGVRLDGEGKDCI